MATPDDVELAKLIAEYERLRHEEHQAFKRIAEIHVRLRDLECLGALLSGCPEWSSSVLPFFITRVSRTAIPDDIEATLDDIKTALDDIGATPDDIELAKSIIEYERLRREQCRTYERIKKLDARLLELERELLPDSYTFSGDPPLT